ncbi:DUF3592 domain-containing protein [Marinifilum sp. RC60d5]|uniref:DUF3592 domain-containing protein n=1 Tax=Marinifilum sp. RC60d5 TaxID=3458414 RepID=UPI004036B3BC
METRQSSIFATFIFALVFIVGGWLFYKHISQTIIDEAKASEKWPAVQGEVTHSKVNSKKSDGKTMYSADIEYSYEVEGVNYTGSRISSVESSTSSYSEVEKDLNKYRVGEVVSVYYNPKIQSISMLEPGAGFLTYVITYGPLLFCFVGLLMLLQVIKKIGLFIIALFVGMKN